MSSSQYTHGIVKFVGLVHLPWEAINQESAFAVLPSLREGRLGAESWWRGEGCTHGVFKKLGSATFLVIRINVKLSCVFEIDRRC